jgi:hypothetical protein
MLSAFVVLQRVQDVWHLLHDKAPSLLDILVGEHGIAERAINATSCLSPRPNCRRPWRS